MLPSPMLDHPPTSPAHPSAPPASSRSPPPQPHARDAAEGLRGFPPPNLQRHVLGLLPVEYSPQGSQCWLSHPCLGASPGSV